MTLRLYVLNRGKREGTIIPIRSFPFLVGRSAHCQLRPVSNLVSHRHCALLCRDGTFFVEDLGSTNGTLVDGKRVGEAVELQDQQRLQIGPLVVQVLLRDGAADAEPPTRLDNAIRQAASGWRHGVSVHVRKES